MPIILLEKDPFAELDQRLDEDLIQEQGDVRRPLYGLRVKSPRFAFISLYQTIDGGTQPISLIDSSAPGGFSYANHNFVIQNVAEQRQEKTQIVETFGDHYAFFYGEKPILLQVQGMLFNTSDFNWKNEFLANYDRFLRGTRCVENKTRVFLGWDDVQAQGYILNVNIAYDKEMPQVVPFSFTMLLTKPPLDLSDASAPIDTPNPGSGVPWTYRSLEASAGGEIPYYPEYLTSPVITSLVTVDPSTGEPTIDSGASGDVAAASDSPKSAYWISGRDPGSKQWNSEDEALFALNAKLAQQQSGSDLTSALIALRQNPSSFQLGTRTNATTSALTALKSGVTNIAAVVDDAPPLE